MGVSCFTTSLQSGLVLRRPARQATEGARERPRCLGAAVEASLYMLAGWQNGARVKIDGPHASLPEQQEMSRAVAPIFSHVLVITTGPCTKASHIRALLLPGS